MSASFIDIELSLEKKDRIIIAHLLFVNNTSNNSYLDRQTICINGEFSRSVFSIIDDNGNKIRYKGEMIKRDVRPEDFIILEPSDSINTSIVLNEGYQLVAGEKYKIKYSVISPSYLEIQPIERTESNEVEIIC